MKNKKIIIIVSVFVLLFVYLLTKNNLNDVLVLKESNNISNKTFAIMVDYDDGKGYVETDLTSWPTDYSYNKNLSNCVDVNGNVVENALIYENGKFILETNKKVKCYVYFYRAFLGEHLVNNPTAGLSTTAYSGMYRYTGSEGNVNNYVKLGNILYRIIGIVSEDNATLGLKKGMVKLIKAESIGTQQWWTNYTTDIKWEQSLIYQRLNDLDTITTNNVLSNTSIIPSNWVDNIALVKWNVGDVNEKQDANAMTNANTIVGHEDNSVTTNVSKIGLMYISDYYYAADTTGSTTCRTSGLCNCWLVDTSNHTWTMSRYGQYTNGDYYVWNVDADVFANDSRLTSEKALRPVFYLNSDVQYTGAGDGSKDNPLQLMEPTQDFGDYLVKNPSAGLSTTVYGGMYRYSGNDQTSADGTIVGTDKVNNYVELGDVLYRIIGVVSEDNETLGLEKGMVKVIKAETIGNQQWWIDNKTDIEWERSLIYQRLNDLDDDETNNVLSNINIIPSVFVNSIASVKWNVGDLKTETATAESVLLSEKTNQTNEKSKIGLMYASDYYYAADISGATNCSGNTLCLNWLTDIDNITWTMTRYGELSSDSYRLWRVFTDGSLSTHSMTNKRALHPVFYLSKDVQYTIKGNGTKANPFQIRPSK